MSDQTKVDCVAYVLQDHLPGLPFSKHQTLARAAIAAMREPSEAMVREGFCTSPDDDAVVVWRTMIDAALKEVGP